MLAPRLACRQRAVTSSIGLHPWAAPVEARRSLLAAVRVQVVTHRALSACSTDPPGKDPKAGVAPRKQIDDHYTSVAAPSGDPAKATVEATDESEKLRQSILAIQRQQEQLLALSTKLSSLNEAAEQKQKVAEREAELNQMAVAKVLARLGEVQDHISHAKYLELCADFGIVDNASDLLRELQESGQILRCESTAIADLVLLNPSALAQRLATAAERPTGTSPAVQRQRHVAASARLKRLSKQLSELEERKQDLDRRASRKVSRNMTVGLGVWSIQVAVYHHLVYAPGALSWDVMEPVAYFTLEAATIGWWL